MRLVTAVLAGWLALPSALLGMSYYVSNSGDDGNAGTSPAAAWASMAKVNGFAFSPGDFIHFECGGQWRGQLVPASGSPAGPVMYTSYGTGAKPLLLGSVEQNRPDDWRPAGRNLWETRPFPVDVGNILFNNGQSCGIKVWEREEVDEPNEFCYDRQKKTVVLYARQNPAALFDDIECALRRHIIHQGGKSYVVYDGLHLAYGAAHGIGGGGTHHITVRNCDLCFIGGGHQFSRTTERGVHHVRYGNGIEFWDGAHDNLVEGCRIWDIYDAGLTNQGGGRNQQYNITYRRNIVWNCEYSFEYWNRPADSETHDIYFEDNVCYRAGHGWSHAQRPWPAGVHLMFFSNQARTKRFFVRRNVFHHAENSFLNIHVDQWNGLDELVLENNTHCQPAGRVLVHWGDRPFTTGQFPPFREVTGKGIGSEVATLVGLAIQPRTAALPLGEAGQIRARATYSNDVTVDVTPLCHFTWTPARVATLESWGRVRAIRPGKSVVTAVFEGETASAAVVAGRGD